MSLQPLFPLWAILLGFVIVLASLAWLEFQRPGPRRNQRLIALVLALLAISGLVLRPSRERIRKEMPILLLTKNFDVKIADSLINLHPDWAIYRTAETQRYSNSTTLKDLVALSGLDHRVGAIVGDGLPKYALEYFSEKYFQFFPSSAEAGIQEVFPKHYTKGQLDAISGIYFLGNAPRRLVLKGPDGVLDSIILDKPGQQKFSLPFTPKSSGRWQYQLLEKDSSGQLLSQDLLAVMVKPEKPLRVLMIQAFPTFESRYLKNFLVDRGHAVAVRAQISSKNFRTEFANLSNLNLSRLTPALLGNFDLLITDAAGFDQISRSEQNNLSDAIEDGLGFLGLVNGRSRSFQSWLGLSNIAAEVDTISLGDGMTLPAYPVSMIPDREWYEVQQTENRQTTAAYFYRGKGKIGFESVQESYAYLLRGDSLDYAAIWMPVLEGTLREAYPDYTIDLLADAPIYVGEPLDFRVTANQTVEAAFMDSLEIPLREDPYLADVWYGRTWPAAPGWHQFVVGNEILEFYAYPEGAWSRPKANQSRKVTAIHAQTASKMALLDQEVKVLEPMSRIWFYLLFLLSAGFLWLAPKL